VVLVPFRNITVRVRDEGRGPAVALLHGYLESLEIWGDFAERLAQNHRVISIDIPGHGQSGVIDSVHPMPLMAEVVETVLRRLKADRCILVGHSMGGYVSLACMDAFPERLAGVCLFHSSPFADDAKKSAARKKEIRLIEAEKFTLICNTSVPRGFAEENRLRMAERIEEAKRIARRTDPAGAIALLEGMRARLDRMELLRRNTLPLLFIIGKKDEYVAFDKLYPLALTFPHTTVNILENSGHSGYSEEPERSLEYIDAFVKKCINAIQ
jgi:pimeloyl-ACP methyl ester carboxylesterase